jgi:REP element-mobilizing transposase RayT
MLERPERKSIRLERSVYGTEGITFLLTIKTHDGRKLFADPRLAAFVFDSIIHGPLFKETHPFAACVMPEHTHLLLQVVYANLIDLVSDWKTYTTNALHRMGVDGQIWQRSFHDHMMRADEDLHAAAWYVANNPAAAGTTDAEGKYPYVWCRWTTE